MEGINLNPPSFIEKSGGWVKILLWALVIMLSLFLAYMGVRTFIGKSDSTVQQEDNLVPSAEEEGLGSTISQEVKNPGSALPETNPFENAYENPFR